MLPALQLLFAIAGTYLLPAPCAARFRAWNEAGEPITLVSWSLPAAQPAPGSDPATTTLLLRQWDSAGTVRFDSTFHVVGQQGTDRASLLSGLLILPRAQSLIHWQLATTAGSGSSELILGAGTQRASQSSELELSDLMIGARNGSAPWDHGAQRTLVAVTGTFDRRDTLQVAFQARSTILRPQTRTTITVTDVSDPRRGNRVLMIASDGVLRAGVNDFERDINVSHLRPGAYLVELQLGDLGHGGAVVQSATFVLRP